MTMKRPVDLTAHDAWFAAHTDATDWARIVAFRARPRFLDGVRRYSGAMQPFFAQSTILNKVVVEAWRFQMLVFTLWLHETHDADAPRSGLTLANLTRVCAAMNLASAGRVFAFVQLMRVGRFLEVAPPGRDARIVRFVPTARFMAIVEEWNAQVFAAIDAANGDDRLTAAASAHPGLGTAMRTRGAQGLLDGWDPLAAFPEFAVFAGCDGGIQLMEHVTLSAVGDDGIVRTGPVALNLRAQARGFGGSRTHLLRLLDRAEAAGMLDGPHHHGSEVRFTERTLCAFLGFIASFLSNFERHAFAALAAGDA